MCGDPAEVRRSCTPTKSLLRWNEINRCKLMKLSEIDVSRRFPLDSAIFNVPVMILILPILHLETESLLYWTMEPT